MLALEIAQQLIEGEVALLARYLLGDLAVLWMVPRRDEHQILLNIHGKRHSNAQLQPVLVPDAAAAVAPRGR